MKELNSAYQTSFNQAIPKIETFLRTHHKFVYSNFDRFCSQNKVKYRANWFSLLRKVEVVKKTDIGLILVNLQLKKVLREISFQRTQQKPKQMRTFKRIL